MTLYERLHRTCATPGCERSADWPADPHVVAAFCRDHTDAMILPEREPEPEWLARVRDGRTKLARDYSGALR